MALGIEQGLGLLILAATFLGFIAKKTKQPTVISYIVTGLILGPVGFELLSETSSTELFSELGLVFLLFLIGLEIDLKEVKSVVKPSIIVGSLQMTLTFLVGLVLASLLGFQLSESIFIGAAAMFSSTALVVKFLADKDQTSTLPGKIDIGVLLIQDIAVVVIFALISTDQTTIPSILLRLAEVLALITMIGTFSVFTSKRALSKLFAKTSGRQHSLFIYSVTWAFMMISFAEFLDISMEIGAFVAGLGLAQLPYSQEIQERVRPLTDLFMAIFFINFGLSITPGQLSAYAFEALVAAIVLMTAKFVIFFSLIDRLKFTPETSFLGSLNMIQNSEFSLIFASLALTEGLISEEIVGFISLLAILTMSISSYGIQYNREIYKRIDHLLEFLEHEDKTDVDVASLKDHIVIIGYDEVIREILPKLKTINKDIMVVDRETDNIELLNEKEDIEYIYGDISHGNIREAANIKNSELIISLVPSFSTNKQILRDKQRDSRAFIKGSNFEDAAELYDLGADYVIIKNLISSEKLSEYLETYIEDKNLFNEETKSDLDKIDWRSKEWQN